MTCLEPKCPPATARLHGTPRGHRSAGHSLLELLLASLIFEVALLAVAPLFVRAVGDARAGAERSRAAALAAGRLESSPAPGSPAALEEPGVQREFYSEAERRWLPVAPPPPDRTLWVALETLRRYPLTAIDDGRVDTAEARTGSGGEPDPPRTVGLLSRTIALSRTANGRALVTLERFTWSAE